MNNKNSNKLKYLITLVLICTFSDFSFGQNFKHKSVDRLLEESSAADSISVSNDHSMIRIGYFFDKKNKYAIVIEKIDEDYGVFHLLKLNKKKANPIFLDTIQIGISIEINLLNLNQDNYYDVYISCSANKVWSYIYIFDLKNESLVKHEKLSSFQEYRFLEVNKQNFIYSYRSLGCADGKWKSTLMKLDGIEDVCLAEMSGDDCDNHEVIVNNTCNPNSLYEKLDYNFIISNYEGDKRLFIKEYWLQYLNR